jgi:2-oxo-4-hydroxy-4-carboxy-5-ureidoimidazoline decarboxylase
MTRRLTMAEVNALDRDAFVAHFGGVFEHSPWVAEAAWHARPFPSADALLGAMLRAGEEAPKERRMALIRSHPDLGARIAMTETSAAEQRSAGLDRLTAEELAELSSLNRTYAERFGFPFILAVRGKTKEEILAALRDRIGRSADEERREALRQIGRIAAFRLADLVGETDPAAGGEAGAFGIAEIAASAGDCAAASGENRNPAASPAGDNEHPAVDDNAPPAVADHGNNGDPAGAAAADAGPAESKPADEPRGGGAAGRLTTHVLDIMRGRPAAGMRIELFRLDEGSGTRVKLRDVRTNADGRTDGPLLAGSGLAAGIYELVFHAGEYFRASAADAGFLDEVPVRFRIADPSAHYHVPLLAAPGGYSTYRGS